MVPDGPGRGALTPTTCQGNSSSSSCRMEKAASSFSRRVVFYIVLYWFLFIFVLLCLVFLVFPTAESTSVTSLFMKQQEVE